MSTLHAMSIYPENLLHEILLFSVKEAAMASRTMLVLCSLRLGHIKYIKDSVLWWQWSCLSLLSEWDNAQIVAQMSISTLL